MDQWKVNIQVSAAVLFWFKIYIPSALHWMSDCFKKSCIRRTAFRGKFHFHPFLSSVPFQEEGEVPSDQSLKEFEGATLRYASINLKYAP